MFEDLQDKNLQKVLDEANLLPNGLAENSKSVYIVESYDENGVAQCYHVKDAIVSVRGDEYCIILKKGKHCGTYRDQNEEYK